MKKIIISIIVLFMALHCVCCTAPDEPSDINSNNTVDKEQENLVSEKSDALTYDELMQMATFNAVHGLMGNIPASLSEWIEQKMEYGKNIVLATVECVDVRYYIYWDKNGHGVYTEYDIKIIEIYEKFYCEEPYLGWIYKEGDIITTVKDDRLEVSPLDWKKTVCEYGGVTLDQNGNFLLEEGKCEWIPTAENVSRCNYWEFPIPLNEGEQYIGAIHYADSYKYLTCDFDLETPISEDSLYLANDGYGMVRDSEYVKAVQDLVDYVRAKETEWYFETFRS